MKTDRKSNIELLRIIAIFFIIIFHCVYKSGFSFEQGLSTNKLIVKTFWMLGELGVNLFFLITGYFMINGKFKVKKLILIITQVFFYHLITIIFANYIGIYEISSFSSLFATFFPLTSNFYWYITAYVLLYILSPYINVLCRAMTKATYQKFLITLLVLYSFIPTFFGAFYNTTESLLYYNRLIWGMIVYFIGAYIKLYSIPLINTKKKSIILACVSALVMIISILIIEKFNNFFAIIGINESAYLWTPNNIPMILLSISIFNIFANLKIKENIFINKLASTTLGIYLLHDGILANWLWKTVFKTKVYQNSPILFFYIIGCGITVFIVGACIDLIRQLIEKNTVKRIIDSNTFDKLFRERKNQ